jgi:hypothetical protein
MYLGAKNNGANPAIMEGNIYYCKIWDGDTLVRDFTPALIKGKYGFWDKVTRRFYTSANPDADFSGPSE